MSTWFRSGYENYIEPYVPWRRRRPSPLRRTAVRQWYPDLINSKYFCMFIIYVFMTGINK